MSFQAMLALLQAFADANGLKMPPAEVLDGMKEEESRKRDDAIQSVFKEVSRESEKRFRARSYD